MTADAIADALVRTHPPLYGAETRRACGFDPRRLLRPGSAPRPTTGRRWG